MENRWKTAVSSSKWFDLINPKHWANRKYLNNIKSKKAKTLFRVVVSLIDIIELLIPFSLFLYAHRFLFFYPLITLDQQIIIYLIILAIIGIFLFLYWKVSRPIRYRLTILWAGYYLMLLSLYNIVSTEFFLWSLFSLIWLSLVYYKFYKIFIVKGDSLFQPQKREKDNLTREEFDFRPGSYKKLFGLLSSAEKEFYRNFLTKAVMGMHVMVFAKVGLKDLVCTNYGKKYFSKISQRHIDFVLCDKGSLGILLAIEYDDDSHRNNEDTMFNDREKNIICEIAKLPLLRVSTKDVITVECLREKIIAHIGLRCADCGQRITPGIEKYCQSFPKRFNGHNYCMDCQNNYP